MRYRADRRPAPSRGARPRARCAGADRGTLAFLCDAYDEENLGTEEKPDVRVVLRLHPALAPFKAAILPLS